MPLERKRTFSGFKSLCTLPFLCKSFNPRKMSSAVLEKSATNPFSVAAIKSPPGQYSITIYGLPLIYPLSME